MTAYRFVTLTCDRCGEVYDSGTPRTTREARAQARREGWAHAVYRNPGGSADYCGRCRARANNQQVESNR